MAQRPLRLRELGSACCAKGGLCMGLQRSDDAVIGVYDPLYVLINVEQAWWIQTHSGFGSHLLASGHRSILVNRYSKIPPDKNIKETSFSEQHENNSSARGRAFSPHNQPLWPLFLTCVDRFR